MFKLTIPDVPDLYAPLISTSACCASSRSPAAIRATMPAERLAQNHGMIASFSRALIEGLKRSMSDAEFDKALAESIDEIYQASNVKVAA